MEKENGFAYQIFILIIIVIIAIAGVLINKIIGKDGMVNRAVEVETEYGKEDVLEKINYQVMQKFIALNNEAKENHQNISDLYNADVVIAFLKENAIIEEAKDDNGNVIEGVYIIQIAQLKEEDDNTIYEGIFQLEKIEDQYKVVYYDAEKNREEIGELQIQQM